MFSTRCNFSTHPNGSVSHPMITFKSAFLISIIPVASCIKEENLTPRFFFKSQVSIRACEESRVLLWHRDKLKLILLSDPFLQAVFDHILGRDVVRKLTQVIN